MVAMNKRKSKCVGAGDQCHFFIQVIHLTIMPQSRLPATECPAGQHSQYGINGRGDVASTMGHAHGKPYMDSLPPDRCPKKSPCLQKQT